MQYVRARPGHAVKDEKAQRAAWDIDAVAHGIGAEQAGILLGAKDVDECRGRHRIDVLGEQRKAARFQSWCDALVHGAEPGDRSKQAERATARRDKQSRVSCRDLADVVARDVGNDEYPGLRCIVERRGDAGGGRARRQMAQTADRLGAAPSLLGIGDAIGQGRRSHHQPMRRLRH